MAETTAAEKLKFAPNLQVTNELSKQSIIIEKSYWELI